MPRPVRVRFAPSPTGLLHVGSAHTALFNWLFARRTGGAFLLRIEDTDVERSRQEWVDAALDVLTWLGLHWDEDIVSQSRRVAFYQQRAEELVRAGKAYYCYCTPEELEARKQEAIQQGRTWQYDRRCAHLSETERQRYEEQGTPRVIRLSVPPGKTRFTDSILGDIEVGNSTIGDFVLVRSDGWPLYHLAVVVDDIAMEISHVIRGMDHVSNTPKHIQLFQAFGYELPEFAHLPNILGPDKKKLSKRHGAVSVSEYRDAGYLPDGIVNFLALLGWSTGDDREFFTRAELMALFSLEQVNKRDTVFDLQKLHWLNGQHINTLSAGELFPLVTPFFIRDGLIDEAGLAAQRARILQVIELLKERCRTLVDFATQGRFFFVDQVDYNPKAVEKHWKDGERVAERMQWLRDRFASASEFSAEHLEAITRDVADAHGLKAAELIHPTRVALTGEMIGPSLFELIVLLGKETTLARLDRACAALGETVRVGK
ncbi:MAG: glutamate--tRNA ligase [Candidatus Latescibacteria bacterium]|nr:glutamate--tRNA ligase [Candidatus Latescibacterota bacterium]